jgi:hypothetical protein
MLQDEGIKLFLSVSPVQTSGKKFIEEEFDSSMGIFTNDGSVMQVLEKL